MKNALAYVSSRYWQILLLPYSDLHRLHMSSIVK